MIFAASRSDGDVPLELLYVLAGVFGFACLMTAVSNGMVEAWDRALNDIKTDVVADAGASSELLREGGQMLNNLTAQANALEQRAAFNNHLGQTPVVGIDHHRQRRIDTLRRELQNAHKTVAICRSRGDEMGVGIHAGRAAELESELRQLGA